MIVENNFWGEVTPTLVPEVFLLISLEMTLSCKAAKSKNESLYCHCTYACIA